LKTIFNLIPAAFLLVKSQGRNILWRMRPAALLCALVLAASGFAGCKREPAEVDGLGPYRVGVMKMKDFRGAACRKIDDGVSHCATFETIEVAGHRAGIDLFFADEDLESPLVEVLLSVQRCRESDAAAAFVEMLGAPGERLGRVLVWPGDKVVAIATLPREPDLCELSFLSPDQTGRIERLRARGDTAAP
jgi:hypothetical protein